ncbi:MAG: helix-turn-helix domain-containing protein [Acidimicrobiales bacterium]
MSDNTIGRALRTRRALLGLDQRDAATRIGMSRTTYSSYERDTQRPSVDVLPAIADFLEISVDEVLVLFGASAIAAARTALGRLSSSGKASAGASSHEDVTSHEIPHSEDMTDGYVNSNGNSHDHDVSEPTPAQPARTVKSKDLKAETLAKVHDEKEKGKKKKKKKEKREKLVNPAFASHV